MKKKLIGYLTILSIFTTPLLHSQEEDSFDDEEEEEVFNRGKIVGKESDEYQRALRRAKWRNWSLAFTSVAAGVTALVLVKQNHPD